MGLRIETLHGSGIHFDPCVKSEIGAEMCISQRSEQL